MEYKEVINMLGVIGAIIFGTVALGAWASDDAAEKRRKQHSIQTGADTYIDKKGRLRYTNGQMYDWDAWRLKEAREYRMILYNGHCKVYKKHGVEVESFRDWMIEKYGTVEIPGYGYIYTETELEHKGEFNI